MGGRGNLVIERDVLTVGRVIGERERPLWRAGEYLQRPRYGGREVVRRDGEVQLPEVVGMDQLSDGNFVEFESQQVVTRTGYTAEEMRAHGCGIASLHMVLTGLKGGAWGWEAPTVGELALRALALHRNDLVERGVTRAKGTPVFNLRSGWYHDAMVYVARTWGEVDGYRCEGLGLGGVVGELVGWQSERARVLGIISVYNEKWRLESEPESIATHQVVVNGFRFGKRGELSALRVADPYKGNELGPRYNWWREIDRNLRGAFTGRAMFFGVKGE